MFDSDDLDEDCKLLVRVLVLGLAPNDRCVTKESGGGNMSTGPPPADKEDSIDEEAFDVRDETVLDPDKEDALGGRGGGGMTRPSASLHWPLPLSSLGLLWWPLLLMGLLPPFALLVWREEVLLQK